MDDQGVSTPFFLVAFISPFVLIRVVLDENAPSTNLPRPPRPRRQIHRLDS